VIYSRFGWFEAGTSSSKGSAWCNSHRDQTSGLIKLFGLSSDHMVKLVCSLLLVPATLVSC
jgi:hypothetical protein